MMKDEKAAEDVLQEGFGLYLAQGSDIQFAAEQSVLGAVMIVRNKAIDLNPLGCNALRGL